MTMLQPDPVLLEKQALQQDVEAREAALDRAHSFIVQAPAGSGKTELLIQRYLALLSAVDAPEEIIAITFTRKAATEMRVRILQALSAAGEADSDRPHKLRTQQLAREALRRDAAKNWALREQPGRMRILTIDALNGWLARQMPWLSGLGPLSAVTDDAAALYRETVRAVLLGEAGGRDVRRAVRRLLVHLDNRFGTIELLLAEMLAIRDQWIGLVEGGLESTAARQLLEHSLKRIITRHLETLQMHLGAGSIDEALELAGHAAAVLSRDAERDSGALAACLENKAVPAADPTDLPVWLALRQLLLTESGTFRSPRGINVRLGFAAGDPMKDRLIALLESLSDNEALRESLAGLRGLPSPAFDETQWDVIGSIVAILGACLEELRAQFTRSGGTDHIEVAAAARRALGGELDPTELAMLLEYRIRHILVDEFQDTSSNQFLLLEQLTAGWSAPDLHTLFLVGDPMQSIYRFREAEVGLFLQVWQQQRLGSVALRPLLLTRNFRSQRGVVSWINSVFARIMPAESDAAAGAVAYSASIAVHAEEEQSADIQVVYSGSRTEEARRVALYLQRVLSGEECGVVDSAAVLVRSRGHLADLVPALRAAGLRFRAVDLEGLGQNAAVRDLLALVRAIVSPADRIAWLSVLRAPYCGLTIADLHALCHDDAQRPLRGIVADETRLARISEDGRRRLARIAPVLEAAIARRGRLTLRALVESCWITLGAPALLEAEDLDAARAFLSLLEQHDEGGDLDDAALLEQSTSLLYAPPDPEGDVRLQLMTIHKAKGLEFDVVVLPRLDGIPRRESDRLLLWDRNLGDGGLAFLIAPLRQRGSDTDATYAFVRASRAQKADHEGVRLLNVAATRAKRRLLLSGTLKERMKNGESELSPPTHRSFLSMLWPIVHEDIEQRYREWKESGSDRPETETTAVAGVLLRRVQAEWTPPAIPEDASADMPVSPGAVQPSDESSRRLHRAGKAARAVGVAVHELLGRLAVDGNMLWMEMEPGLRRTMISELLQEAGLQPVDTDAMQRAYSAIERTLGDERGRWLLHSHEHSENELAMTGVDDDRVLTIRIDRTFVDEDGVRWIVDYKTAFHEGAGLEEFLGGQVESYRAQLERYIRFMRKWDSRPVRAALYFPLLQEWREIIVRDDLKNDGGD
jgi:ATP-dependent helicase/nuclease subunit A